MIEEPQNTTQNVVEIHPESSVLKPIVEINTPPMGSKPKKQRRKSNINANSGVKPADGIKADPQEVENNENVIPLHPDVCFHEKSFI
jgi:hypothetical protein